MKDHNQVSLKEALGQMFDQYGLSGRLKSEKIINQWEEIVGPLIAKYTKSVKIEQQKLIIRVESAPLKQELFYLKEQIAQKINDMAEEEVVTEVVVKS